MEDSSVFEALKNKSINRGCQSGGYFGKSLILWRHSMRLRATVNEGLFWLRLWVNWVNKWSEACARPWAHNHQSVCLSACQAVYYSSGCGDDVPLITYEMVGSCSTTNTSQVTSQSTYDAAYGALGAYLPSVSRRVSRERLWGEKL